MSRANIDLSWLASLLTKTPTTADNANTPDLAPGSEGKFLDPTGTLHGDTIDISNPYQSPTTMQRLVWPDQSAQIDKLNNQYSSQPLMANLENSTNLNIRAGNVKKLDPSLQPNESPLAAAAGGYGSLDTSPSYINQQNQALLNAQHGLPGVRSATDLNTGQYDLTASKGAVDRQQMEQSAISGDLVNRWNTAYGLTPQQISLAERQVKSELGFQGSVEQIREQALKNQFDEQSHLIPAQNRLSLTQTTNAQNAASEQQTMWPYAKTALDNRMIGEAATSHYLPEMDRFGNTIQPDGSIKPFTKNPLGASPFAVQMQSLGDLTGADVGQTIKSADGKHTYTIPAAPPSNIDPLTGGSVSKSFTTLTGIPTITSTNGPTVTHDTTGSMSPPVTHGLSTLPQSTPDDVDSIRNEMSKLENSYYQYPDSQSGIRYKYLKGKLDELVKHQSNSNSRYIVPSSGFNLPSSLR